MLATLTLVTFLCTLTPDNKDKCETDYLLTWQGVSDYRKDKEDCETELKSLFPDDIRTNEETKQYQFAGCYRVLPGESVGLPSNKVYLQNIQDADDNFSDYRSNLEVE